MQMTQQYSVSVHGVCAQRGVLSPCSVHLILKDARSPFEGSSSCREERNPPCSISVGFDKHTLGTVPQGDEGAATTSCSYFPATKTKPSVIVAAPPRWLSFLTGCWCGCSSCRWPSVIATLLLCAVPIRLQQWWSQVTQPCSSNTRKRWASSPWFSPAPKMEQSLHFVMFREQQWPIIPNQMKAWSECFYGYKQRFVCKQFHYVLLLNQQETTILQDELDLSFSQTTGKSMGCHHRIREKLCETWFHCQGALWDKCDISRSNTARKKNDRKKENLIKWFPCCQTPKCDKPKKKQPLML